MIASFTSKVRNITGKRITCESTNASAANTAMPTTVLVSIFFLLCSIRILSCQVPGKIYQTADFLYLTFWSILCFLLRKYAIFSIFLERNIYIFRRFGVVFKKKKPRIFLGQHYHFFKYGISFLIRTLPSVEEFHFLMRKISLLQTITAGMELHHASKKSDSILLFQVAASKI